MEVVCKLGWIEEEELRFDGVEIFLGLYHTTGDLFEDTNTVLFGILFATGDDHYSLVAIH